MLLAEVTAVNLADRTVDAAVPGVGVRKVAFDFLVVATGMRPSYFGHDEFARVKVTLRENRRIDPARASIIMVDGAKRVLPTFAESVSRRVAKRLNKLGVKVLTEIKVETVDEQGVIAGETRIPSATVLWTAGAAASPIPKMLGTKTDRTGRTLVDPFLKVADAPGVFVVGDAASAMQNEHPVPGDENGETVDGEPQCGGARTPSPTLRFRSCSRPRCRCSR